MRDSFVLGGEKGGVVRPGKGIGLEKGAWRGVICVCGNKELVDRWIFRRVIGGKFKVLAREEFLHYLLEFFVLLQFNNELLILFRKPI